MKKTILVMLTLGLITLSGFNKEPLHYEQIAFDYFISDILENDFKDIAKVEFKGKPENSHAGLGDYKFCLKPEERLGSSIKEITKGPRQDLKPVNYKQLKDITIVDFKDDTVVPKLYLYPSVRVADNFYVFLSLQKPNEPIANYVIELNPNGNISRSCRMN
jgi:hypothetical protein